jgi:hypothetical protein
MKPARVSLPVGMTVAMIEQWFLQEIRTPEAQALLGRLLTEAENTIESQSSNPFLTQLEKSAFAMVRGYLELPISMMHRK